MDLETARELYARRMRSELCPPGCLRETGPHTIRLIEPGFSCVIHSSFGNGEGATADLATLDEAIEAEIARFRELGVEEFEWKLFGSDRPPELRARLEAHGFLPKEPADAVLVLDLLELPQALRGDGGHDIRRMEGQEAIEATLAVSTAVWPEEDPAAYRSFLEHSLRSDPGAVSFYVAWVDGVPVAEGRVDYAGREFAGLWGGATLPAYRGRGLYTALVAARAAEALGRGCRYLTIDASPMSRSVLEKRGFVLLDTALECNYSFS
jgi:GNAT superfamily N-acetyltransferase